MVAANKIDPIINTPQHSPRLTSLLLDKNYKNNYSTSYQKPTIEIKPSRIEAEFQMEKIFMNLF